MNRKLCLILALLALAVSARSQLVITEVMSNSDHPGGAGNGDWFEIFNSGASAVDLTGYIWNDANDAATGRAVFPSVTIASGEAICIVDENTSNIGAWKTNVWGLASSVQALTKDDFGGDEPFSGLSASGDAIYLFDASSNLLTSVTFGDSAGGGKTFEWDSSGNSLGFSVNGENGAFVAPGDGVGGAGIDVGSPASVSQSVPVNVPPEITVSPYGDTVEVRDGDVLQLTVIASEPQSADTNDTVTLWAADLPADAVWTPAVTSAVGAVTNTFEWEPKDVQTTNITFYASDKDGTNSVTVSIEVRPDQDLVVNEYSAVANDKYLGGGLEGDAYGSDAHFGRILGNGGNWIEFVVMKDHLDIRGWQLYLAEAEDYDGDHDIWFGSTTAKQSIVTFSTNALWSDLRRGTILTLAEEASISGQSGYSSLSGTDTGFDPDADDWWIHISSRDEFLNSADPLVITTNNVPGDNYGDGRFSVGNSGWEIIVRDETGGRVAGPIGEVHGGSGISSTEAGILETAPAFDVDAGDYRDGTNTTFGSANETGGEPQRFDWLRAWHSFTNNGCGLVINEFNTVATNQILNDGDSVLGRLAGNGGDWIELVVAEDHLDIRGWALRWAQPGAEEGVDFNTSGDDIWYGNEDIMQGSLQFASNSVWTDLRIGTIITISEAVTMTNESGSTVVSGTDASVSPQTDDWWIHISTLDEAGNATPLVVTEDNDDDSPAGSFEVGHKDWQVSLVDETGALLAGPIGEVWVAEGLGSDEAMVLEAAPSTVVEIDDYDVRDDSTFSQPNVWSGASKQQRWAALRGEQTGDADSDGLSDGEEYIAGTDPEDDTSRFLAGNIQSTTGVSLRFYGLAERLYTVEWRTSLTEGVWQPMDPVPGSNAWIDIPATNAPNRFYRLSVELE